MDNSLRCSRFLGHCGGLFGSGSGEPSPCRNRTQQTAQRRINRSDAISPRCPKKKRCRCCLMAIPPLRLPTWPFGCQPAESLNGWRNEWARVARRCDRPKGAGLYYVPQIDDDHVDQPHRNRPEPKPRSDGVGKSSSRTIFLVGNWRNRFRLVRRRTSRCKWT